MKIKALLFCQSKKAMAPYRQSLVDEGLTVVCAESQEEVFVLLGDYQFGVVVLLQAQNGPNEKQMISKLGDLCPQLPVVVAIGDSEALTQATLYQGGEVEEARGPLGNPQFLGMVVALYVLRRENQRLRHQSNVDELTGLYNRRFLHQRLEEELLRSQRIACRFSLLMIDLDNFKQVNDAYGHPVGDDVLVRVGEFLLSSVRGVDTVARYGGDEFVVLLVQAPPLTAESVAKRLVLGMAGIADEIGLKNDINMFPLSASVGCSGHGDEAVTTSAELLRQADKALYSAKRSGGNCVRIYGVKEPLSLVHGI